MALKKLAFEVDSLLPLTPIRRIYTSYAQRRGKCYNVGGANLVLRCDCDSSSGTPLVHGWGQSHSESEALTNLHFFVAMLKTVCLGRKSAFLKKMFSVTLTFESMTLETT